MRRAVALVALGVSVAVALAGCAGGGEEPRVLEFWGLGREGEVVSELVPEFERRHPGLRVAVQQVPWGAAHEKLLTAHVGRATPDLAQVGNTWIPELQEIGALARLDPWLEASPAVDPDDYFAGVWDTNVLAVVEAPAGALFGVPWYVDTRVLFYRTDLLARAGFSRPPRDWGEWREAMERVKSLAGPQEYAILFPADEWAQPVIFGMQLGAPLIAAGRHAAFAEERFARAVEFYVAAFRDGLTPLVANAQVSNVYQEFARGTFAMYVTGPWNLGEFRRRVPELAGRWSTAPLPAPESGSGAPGVSLAGGSSLVVFAASRRQADAWRLIEFLSEPAQQARFYELTGDLPARRSAWEAAGLAHDAEAAAFLVQLQHVRPVPKVPEWERIAFLLAEELEPAIRGRRAVGASLAALDRRADRILEKRRWVLARRAGAER
jgi:multiple sugar transport system substrate-binding protein